MQHVPIKKLSASAAAKRRKAARAYYMANRKQLLEYGREWYQANRKRHMARVATAKKKRFKENPDAVRAERRAIKRKRRYTPVECTRRKGEKMRYRQRCRDALAICRALGIKL